MSVLLVLPVFAALVTLIAWSRRPRFVVACRGSGHLLTSARRRVRGGHADRGDIPGWVMIAIMSAAVVSVLIPLVGPTIAHAFTNAVNTVSTTTSTTN